MAKLVSFLVASVGVCLSAQKLKNYGAEINDLVRLCAMVNQISSQIFVTYDSVDLESFLYFSSIFSCGIDGYCGNGDSMVPARTPQTPGPSMWFTWGDCTHWDEYSRYGDTMGMESKS